MFGKKKDDFQSDLSLYLIYDSKVGSYSRPNFAINDLDLRRQVVTMFRDPAQSQNPYLLNSEDYQLFSVGDLDLKTGEFRSNPPRHVFNMHDLRFESLIKKPTGIDPT